MWVALPPYAFVRVVVFPAWVVEPPPQAFACPYAEAELQVNNVKNKAESPIIIFSMMCSISFSLLLGCVGLVYIPHTRVMRGRAVEDARDRVLLATDSFLYECRSFLDLVARFTYAMLAGIGKQPAAKQQLSSGQTVKLVEQRGSIRSHDFLLFLCDQLQVPTAWFFFLSSHRNFFTHQATPYCAVEEIAKVPTEYDLLIMRTNILDFSTADPKDYFRIS